MSQQARIAIAVLISLMAGATVIAADVSTPVSADPLGAVNQFTDPDDQMLPYMVAPGTDGNMWFTDFNNKYIGRITPSGVITKYTDPSIAFPEDITEGPDGNLWFTDFDGNAIWRITPAGVFTRFTSPKISGPAQITAGPDGNVWFTNYTGNSIARITPTGTVTSYMSMSLVKPYGIALDPEGNVWFTLRSSHMIGEMFPSGNFTYTYNGSVTDPYDITAGPDGNMWFTDKGSNMIVRITPSRSVTTFEDASISKPLHITTGSDGNLWYTMEDKIYVGRITPTGTVTSYAHSWITQPRGIAAGTDGNIWVTNKSPKGSFSTIGTGVPSAPSKPTTTPGDTTVTVNWMAPSNGGNPITKYTVRTVEDPSKMCTAMGTTQCTVNGLTNGTSYRFQVRATNAKGDGPWSPPSDPAVPVGAPSQPAKPTAIGGNNKATVSWTAPDNGGSPITGYTVTSSPGNKTCTTTGTRTCTVTGLTNGTAYSFRVRATNAKGDGPWSPPSDLVIPNVPGSTYYHPMSPTRLIDPRPAWKVGPFSTPWTKGLARDVQVTGQVGIPTNAKAVVLNVTVTDVTAPGGTFISVYPKGGTRPNVSSLNASYGQTIANSVTTKVGDGGQITIYNDQAKANVIVDVAGYYTEGSGDGYVALAPTRLIDSRPAWKVGPFSTPWTAGLSRDVTIEASTGVPVGADAVVLNVTATDVTQPTFISVYPKGTTRPNASNLNLAAGNTIANQVVVKIGTGHQISVYNEAGSANVIVDVVGYYRAGSGDAFYPVAPERIIDPRPAWQVGPFNTPWGNQATRQVQVTTKAGVPTSAKAVVMNVTATDVTSTVGTFVTVFPGGTVPNASSLNASSGWTIANAVTAKLSTDGKVSVYNEKPTANIIVDVNGYFG